MGNQLRGKTILLGFGRPYFLISLVTKTWSYLGLRNDIRSGLTAI
jgi:hypothetical protein